MNRADLMNVIDNLRHSVNIEHDIDKLEDCAKNFCDHYEANFNDIRDGLEGLADHIPSVNEAFKTAKESSESLY